jgi:hypothetical protein
MEPEQKDLSLSATGLYSRQMLNVNERDAELKLVIVSNGAPAFGATA